MEREGETLLEMNRGILFFFLLWGHLLSRESVTWVISLCDSPTAATTGESKK